MPKGDRNSLKSSQEWKVQVFSKSNFSKNIEAIFWKMSEQMDRLIVQYFGISINAYLHINQSKFNIKPNTK